MSKSVWFRTENRTNIVYMRVRYGHYLSSGTKDAANKPVGVNMCLPTEPARQRWNYSTLPWLYQSGCADRVQCMVGSKKVLSHQYCMKVGNSCLVELIRLRVERDRVTSRKGGCSPGGRLECHRHHDVRRSDNAWKVLVSGIRIDAWDIM